MAICRWGRQRKRRDPPGGEPGRVGWTGAGGTGGGSADQAQNFNVAVGAARRCRLPAASSLYGPLAPLVAAAGKRVHAAGSGGDVFFALVKPNSGSMICARRTRLSGRRDGKKPWADRGLGTAADRDYGR